MRTTVEAFTERFHSIAELEIETMELIIDSLEEIKEVVKSFDGKKYTVRVEKAILEKTGVRNYKDSYYKPDDFIPLNLLFDAKKLERGKIVIRNRDYRIAIVHDEDKRVLADETISRLDKCIKSEKENIENTKKCMNGKATSLFNKLASIEKQMEEIHKELDAGKGTYTLRTELSNAVQDYWIKF